MTEFVSMAEYEAQLKRDSKFWRPSVKGDTITGAFQGFVNGRYGLYPVINTDSGEKGLPKSRIIGKQLSKQRVQPGEIVTITYDGEVDTGGPNHTKLYTVEVKR